MNKNLTIYRLFYSPDDYQGTYKNLYEKSDEELNYFAKPRIINIVASKILQYKKKFEGESLPEEYSILVQKINAENRSYELDSREGGKAKSKKQKAKSKKQKAKSRRNRKI